MPMHDMLKRKKYALEKSKAIMIVCELKSFSHISNRHNMSTLMKSCDIFHTQHTTFFATLDTCAGTI